ncbi:MAG: Spy/CpxP family protein refolding chaperone [Hydrogenophaga sp.]|jgi:Spy/CpxP family protein refolding chaperone|uniref:Spy/CpxP family protein refolding chaperone n=1 Tax=Hydrogenophaga sp. TaxID=1904254 RepID=UPI001DAFCBC5|nr:Spy/CpxP family protein refolding chaperone [Hydrogenophaga sp.]MBW0169531.1 Spy/CpxP family protein refolding chaperone [Hydrogenophaga sp.]MBW0186339.1 Spy/CpxP family protein refolding chaperone [Hydrogenophaga sp.]
MKPWIQRSLMAFTGVALAVGGLAACGTRHHERGPMSPEKIAEVRGKVVERITSKLDLNAEQQQKLNVLADKVQAQRTALIGQTPNPRAEFSALVAGEKFDRARALNLLDEKTRVVQVSSPDVINAMADFYDSLNPAQQAEVRERMGQRKGWFSRG